MQERWLDDAARACAMIHKGHDPMLRRDFLEFAENPERRVRFPGQKLETLEAIAPLASDPFKPITGYDEPNECGSYEVEPGLYPASVEREGDHAMYMLDPTGVVLTWNQVAQRIHGYEPEEILGRKFDCFFGREDHKRGKPQKILEIALRDGRYEAQEIRVRKEGNRYWSHVVLQPLWDKDRTLVGFAESANDITEQRLAREELDRTRATLARSQKLEAIGQFAGKLAHDFGNLLMAVRLNLDYLRDGTLSAPQEEAVQNAIAEVDRGSEAVRSILIFARDGSLDAQVTDDLNAAIEQMSGLLRQTIGARSTVEISFRNRLWPVKVNRNQLELAFLNLAINARDAMADRGAFRVTASNVSLAGSPNGLTGQFVALSAADNGCGMSPEIAARATEPFFTTKYGGKGTGLGLSQVYGFAKDCGGTITLESTVGKGTTITIYIPKYQPRIFAV